MDGLLLSFQGAIAQGVIWGIMALGVYITFKILNIADMTVDGSFATGGAVGTVLIVGGVNPLLAVLIAMLVGSLAGLVTGILITKFEIPAILAGILSQIGLYSINLRIMGKSNISLIRNDTLFSEISSLTGLSDTYAKLLLGLIVVVIIIISLYWFFGTEIGSAIRATGNNEQMVSSVGVNTKTTKLIGLMLSNGLIGLAGALVAQSQGSADVKLGVGSIIIGLASVVIGEVLFGKDKGFKIRLTSIIVGSIIYRIVIAIVLQLGLNTDDLKLFTAIFVAIALAFPIMYDKRKRLVAYKRLMRKEVYNA